MSRLRGGSGHPQEVVSSAPRRGDHRSLLSLNNIQAPAVNAISLSELRQLLEWPGHAIVGRDFAGPTGFVLAIDGPGLDYPSDNYRWFSERYDHFLYVDRIAVHPRAHGRGIGSSLYEALVGHAARAGYPFVLAEVNTRPPNDGSHRFHLTHGFTAVGEQETKGGTVRVRMYERRIRAADQPPSRP
ncbi:MAG: GNAT family N-acetyltransferase [Acidimicrobiia bacterium]|nr:GNAT family N-acetyltransferase [Acidimicrobiia bacterium]